MNIVKKVYLTIEGYDLIRNGETVICGVSGGPDSICMLHVLKELNDIEGPHWNLIVVHVNHGLRGKEADEDEKFVRNVAQKLELRFISKKIDVKQLKEQESMSIEEAARKLRYDVFKQFAIDYCAQKIALGHTLDDNAETILFRIIRGTGLRGLRGIPSIRMASKKHELFVIRPLIEVERSEVEQYIKDKRLSYRIDSTNKDLSLTRNFIRQELIPLVEKRLNPKIKHALIKLGQISRSFYVCMREISKEIYESVKLISKEDEICFAVQEFLRFPPAVQTLVIDNALKKLLGKVPHLNFEHYIGVISLCGEYGYGKVVQLPKGLIAKRESYLIKIFKPSTYPKKPRFSLKRLNVPGNTLVKRLNLEINSEVVKGKVVGLQDYIKNKDYTEEIVDYLRLQMPLTVRLRKRGDVFKPLGSPGHCKLKDFFIGQKIPREYRDHIPLVVDKKGRIVWVVGYRISDEVKITDSTKQFLRLKIKRLSI